MNMIEPAQPQDGPAIREVNISVGVFTAPEIRCVDELWDDYVQRGDQADYHFLVYREHGTILGYACYGDHALTEGTWDLYWIAVSPAAHGRGIGHALLASTEAGIAKRGGYLVLVETSTTPAYAPARRLYQSAGYTLRATIPDFYARGDGLALYSKHLS